MKGIVSLTLIIVAYCGPKQIKKAYVNELSGIQLQRTEPLKPWPESDQIVRAPFGSVIEVFANSEKRFGNYRDPWFKAKFQNETLWVSEKDLSFSGISKFYMIVTKAGLNLRQGPGTNSTIITVIPFEAKGSILDVKNDVMEIQGRRGFWLKIDHNGKQGWVFSGFVLTGNSKDELKLERVSLKSDPMPLKPSEKPPTNAKSILDNTAFAFTRPAPECYESLAKNLGQVRIAQDGRFYTVEAEHELVVKTDPEIPRHLVTEAHFCVCCCGNIGNLVYLTPKGQTTVAYRFDISKYEGSCFEGPWASNESRISADRQRIYVYKKLPICAGTFSTDEGPGTGISTNKVEYISGVFKIIDLTTDLVEQIDSLTIPAKYQEEWNKSIQMRLRN